MVLLDVSTGYVYNCRLITAKRNKAKKSLGGDWYDFVRDNKLQEGDRLVFDLDDPSTVLSVQIVPANDLA
jgi:hypothetical protein